MTKNEVRFDPNDGILYTYSSNVTTLEHMLQGIDGIISNKELPRELKILEDGRGAQVTFPPKDLSILVDKLELALLQYLSLRQAVVHDDPRNTALAVLINRHMKNEKYVLEVFSTIEAARLWLLL
jgi:hypothetical protein